MKTEVIMRRKLFGEEISQQSKSEMFSATDLVRAGNKWRVANGMDFFKMSAWLQQKGTREFISELEQKFGKGNVKKSGRGRGKHTWVHPLLFIDMALAINPKLKIEVYQWLYDYLIAYRNSSGDSYNMMCGALFNRFGRKADFRPWIRNVARRIQIECGIPDDWQSATEEQLAYRDRLHRSIALLAEVLRDAEKAVEEGIRTTRMLDVQSKSR